MSLNTRTAVGIFIASTLTITFGVLLGNVIYAFLISQLVFESSTVETHDVPVEETRVEESQVEPNNTAEIDRINQEISTNTVINNTQSESISDLQSQVIDLRNEIEAIKAEKGEASNSVSEDQLSAQEDIVKAVQDRQEQMQEQIKNLYRARTGT